MDDDDQMAAEAYQQELEQRQREEEAAIARSRRLVAVFRWRNRRYERDQKAREERMRKLKWPSVL